MGWLSWIRNLPGLNGSPPTHASSLHIVARPHGSLAIFSPSNKSSQILMPDLSLILERLGLTAYSKILTDNGFGTWETVLDITEEDLTALKFKLGHRRALQREIATYRGVPSTLALEPDSSPDDYRSPPAPALESVASPPTTITTTTATTTPPPREKRRYRRHARPDNNAPKKPKTACMLVPDPLVGPVLTIVQM
jgi:hypothetical protein